jgi:hypothetical protein
MNHTTKQLREKIKKQMLDDFRQKFNEGYFINPLTNDESVNKLEHYISFLIDRFSDSVREEYKGMIESLRLPEEDPRVVKINKGYDYAKALLNAKINSIVAKL